VFSGFLLGLCCSCIDLRGHCYAAATITVYICNLVQIWLSYLFLIIIIMLRLYGEQRLSRTDILMLVINVQISLKVLAYERD